ncbi:hypothetical protein ACHAWF_013047 [Thalassiosira exigua]
MASSTAGAAPPKAPRSGLYQIVETVFLVVAFVLMWIEGIRCDFVKFTDTSGTSEPVSLRFGVWNFQFWSLVSSVDGTFVFESCRGYPDYVTIDPAWKAARAFAVLTFLFAVVLFVFTVVNACTSGPPRAWTAPLYFLTSFCQGMILLMLNSDACRDNAQMKLVAGVAKLGSVQFPDTCSMSGGAKLCISAVTFWAGGGVASFLAHKSSKEEEAAKDALGLDEPLNP